MNGQNNYVRIGSIVKIGIREYRVAKIKSRLEIFISDGSRLMKIKFDDIDQIIEY